MSKLLTYGSVGGAPGNRCASTRKWEVLPNTKEIQNILFHFSRPKSSTLISFMKAVFLLT